MVIRVRHKDGTWRVLDSVGTAYRTGDGELIGVINSRDITDRRLAEERLLQSERLYRTVVEDQTEFIVRWQHGGVRTFVNQAYCEYFGQTREELVGTSFQHLIAEEDCAAVETRLAALTAENPTSTREHRVKRPDGSIAWNLWTDRAVFDEDGELIEYQSVGRDTTDLKKAHEAQEILQEQLIQSQKMEALGTLAGGIAHDFNNILLAVLGYSELVKDQLPEGSLERYNMEQVLNAGERAKGLVRRILAFSRQSEPELRPRQLHGVVREALGLLRTSLPSTIEIRQKLDPEAGVVLVDTSQVHQAILNLGSNAGHAMRESGGVLEIVLEPEEFEFESSMTVGAVKGSYVRLEVRDTGSGMDQSTTDAMFEPFFTTKEIGEGTGLGLSVVHGIVQGHRGAIRVESAVGEGTIFRLYFPTVEGDELQPSGHSDVVAASGERILFVDDEELVADLGQQMLTRMGYAATARTSSAEALELFRAQPASFDVIVTDYTMPHMTGVQLACEIRRISPDIPIIIATGYSDTIIEQAVSRERITSLLTKPYSVKVLSQAVRNALNGSCQPSAVS